MTGKEEIKGIKKTKHPLITSIAIINFLLLTRSIILPDQVFVIKTAMGRIIYNPATAAAEPVKLSMEIFKAIR
ncbi:hypothetical protein J6TS2_07250 [Heyndrickxia sporothermodurans]|nr:hypothetical protein J6TS2_07250 [Heyndrickxia sporothermodurans]